MCWDMSVQMSLPYKWVPIVMRHVANCYTCTLYFTLLAKAHSKIISWLLTNVHQWVLLFFTTNFDTLIQNRGWRSPLASPCDGRTHQSSQIFPAIVFWVCSLETWDDGARRLLTLKISLRRLDGQPAVGASAQVWFWPPRTPRSSRCHLQVYRCVCVCLCTTVLHWHLFIVVS